MDQKKIKKVKTKDTHMHCLDCVLQYDITRCIRTQCIGDTSNWYYVEDKESE